MDKKTFTDQLITKALTGKHSNFEFIRNIQQFKIAKEYMKALKATAKSFHKVVKLTYKSWVKEVDELAKQQLIFSGQIFNKCEEYYVEEFKIIKDMISEYKIYLLSGSNLFDSYVINKERADDELFDYRKVKWRLF